MDYSDDGHHQHCYPSPSSPEVILLKLHRNKFNNDRLNSLTHGESTSSAGRTPPHLHSLDFLVSSERSKQLNLFISRALPVLFFVPNALACRAPGGDGNMATSRKLHVSQGNFASTFYPNDAPDDEVAAILNGSPSKALILFYIYFTKKVLPNQ